MITREEWAEIGRLAQGFLVAAVFQTLLWAVIVAWGMPGRWTMEEIVLTLFLLWGGLKVIALVGVLAFYQARALVRQFRASASFAHLHEPAVVNVARAVSEDETNAMLRDCLARKPA